MRGKRVKPEATELLPTLILAARRAELNNPPALVTTAAVAAAALTSSSCNNQAPKLTLYIYPFCATHESNPKTNTTTKGLMPNRVREQIVAF